MFRSNIKQVHCSGVAAECIYEEYRSSDIFQDLVNSVTGGPSLVLGRSVIGGPSLVLGRSVNSVTGGPSLVLGRSVNSVTGGPSLVLGRSVNSVTGGPFLLLGRSVIGGPHYVPGRRGGEDHLLYQVGGGVGGYILGSCKYCYS